MAIGTYGVANASPQVRGEFLQKVAAWTFGGLLLAGLSSIVSVLFLVPVVARLGTLGVLVAVYGSFFVSQSIARGMVHGGSKVAGFVLGNAAQGAALGFLLASVVYGSGISDGMRLIASCLFITLASAGGMLAYVTTFRSNFSMLGSALSMLTLPMLLLLGIQLVFPIGGTLGLVFAGVFLAVSVGSLLYTLNTVVHHYDPRMTVEGGYELSSSIIVVLWNLISLMNRLRNN